MRSPFEVKMRSNSIVSQLIRDLKRSSHEHNVAIWRDIAKRLERPLRSWAEVNLLRIERYAKKDETVVVPGKVLGVGTLTKPVTIAAYSFSQTAKRKIADANGAALSITELMAANPNGRNVRIMG